MGRHPPLRFAFFLLAWFGLSAAGVGAEPLSRVTLPGEAPSTGRRLAAADQLAADLQWSEAVAEYQRIIDEAGDDLVPVHVGLSVQVRKLCHLRLAALPAAALRLYRDKVDAQARQWLTQGEAERDPNQLRKVIDEAFCSRSGDRALELLGDLAFERGDFDGAERWWRMIVRPALPSAAAKGKHRLPATGSLTIVYPDPQVDVARVRAKQILAHVFRGETEDSAELLEAYRAAHGKAAGEFAGRNGNYAQILKDLAKSALAAPPERPWTTFAGAPTRSLLVSEAPRRLDRPTWTWQLDVAANPAHKVQTWADKARDLVFHPVILGDQVLLADAHTVTAFDLLSGERAVWYDLLGNGKNDQLGLPAKPPSVPDLRYTLTVGGECVYVRMGSQGIGPRSDNEARTKGADDSLLVCLNRRPGADGGRLRWTRKANRTDRSAEMFEGSPLFRDGRVYMAATRFDGANGITAVACFDALTGAEQWRKAVDICEAPAPRATERRWQHRLLTLAGSHVVYCSHSGAVVALETETGRRAWGTRYASRGEHLPDATPSPRDLAPCVYAAGRLFIAPADHGRVFCLDAETGQRLWEGEPPIEAVHLLGVARDRLILVTPADVRALAVDTGRTLWLCPGVQPFGRGLLAGSSVICPTRHGLRIVDQADGQPVADAYNYLPNDVRGNVVIGNGCLIVADRDKLTAYVPPRRLLEQRRHGAQAEPHSATERYQLAIAEADAGLREPALNDLRRVELEADANERWQDLSLRSLAHQRRHQWLLTWAARDQSRRQWDEAAALLTRAAASEFSVPQRLEALTAVAALWTTAGQPAKAVQAWQNILDDEALGRGVREERGACRSAVSAAPYAARQIGDLIRQHGAAVYESIEQRAQALLDATPANQRARLLEQLGRRFPNAAASGPGLLQVASHYVQAGRLGAAAQAYRRYLKIIPASPERATALAGLARAYEMEHCWQAAQETWQRLDREFGDQTLVAVDPTQSVRAFVAEQLRETATHLPQHKDPAGFKLPLTRTWQVSLDQPARDGISPSPSHMLVTDDAGAPDGTECLYFTRRAPPRVILTSRRTATGELRWERPLSLEPTWIGRHADIVLAGASEGIVGLSLADGTPCWEFVFAAVLDDASADTDNGRWQLAGGRLFRLHAGRRLFALDAESGEVLWARWAPGARFRAPEGGRFHPFFHAGEQRITLQTDGGRLWVLDSQTGRTVHERETAKDAWPHPPLAMPGGRLCLVPDAEHVALFDPATGKELWSHAPGRPTISGDAPQVAFDGQALLVFNDGWQLESLDPRTGAPRWTIGDPQWLSRKSTEPWQAGLDANGVYFIRHNILYAHDLAGGKQLWSSALDGPAGPWRVRALRNGLIVFPDVSQRRTKRPLGLGGYLLAVPHATEEQNFPVLICDPKDGTLIQRLNFSGAAEVHFLAGGAAAVAAGKLWGFASTGAAANRREPK